MTPSPCVGLCRIDPATQLCGGCARSGAEIAAWKDASAADRARVWADLPARRAELGIGLHRLGWTLEEILDFVRGTLQGGCGSWTIGIGGASAEFGLGRADHGMIAEQGPTITATTPVGAVRFAITERVRVLALPPRVAAAQTLDRIVLALPRIPHSPRPSVGLTSLGTDRDAIRPADRTARLYDLGLDSEATACCLRTTNRDLAAELDRRIGQDAARLLGDLGDRLAGASSDRVVSNPVARVELFAPVGPSASRLPAHSFVRFDPGRMAWGCVTPPEMDIPESFVPCAIFDPATNRREVDGHPGRSPEFRPITAQPG